MSRTGVWRGKKKTRAKKKKKEAKEKLFIVFNVECIQLLGDCPFSQIRNAQLGTGGSCL
jgi:hypothetical protein